METLTIKEQAENKAVLDIVLAVCEAIRELGEVPSGHLYARLMGMLSLEQYTRILDVLKNAGLVKEENSHLLKWIGPLKGMK